VKRSLGISVSLAAIAIMTASLGGCSVSRSAQSVVPASSQPASQPTFRPTTAPTTPLATLFHTPGGYCALCAAQKQAQIDPETNRPAASPANDAASNGDGDLLRDLPR
jgi:hypothetical protein